MGKIRIPKIETNLPLLFLPLFIGAIEVEPVPNQNVVFAVFFKVFSHLSSIDEVENLLHEVVEKDRLTEAKAKVPESGESIKEIVRFNF